MNLSGSFLLKFSRSGVWIIFLFFIQVAFWTSERFTFYFFFTAKVVKIRDVIVLDVDQAFALVDFLASKYFNFDRFLIYWKTKWFFSWKIFAFYFVWDFNDQFRLVFRSYGSGFAYNFSGEALFYCPRVGLFFRINFASDWGFYLGDASSPVRTWGALRLPFC